MANTKFNKIRHNKRVKQAKCEEYKQQNGEESTKENPVRSGSNLNVLLQNCKSICKINILD